MRLTKARIEPLDISEMDEEAKVAFGSGPILNIFRTLAHHPKLMKRWLVFGNHILGKNSLTPRDRELAILRVGWLCRAEYEWAQHARIALNCDIDEEEIERVAHGPQADGWTAQEAALLTATDELVGDAFIQDTTWNKLGEFYDKQQLIDLVFTVGQYNMVSMALNTLGVQLEDGTARFPKV